MSKRAAPRLQTVDDISIFLAKLIRQVYREEFPASSATKIGYLANILISTIETAQIERRLEALENKTNN
jgi:hypothetical protein